MKNNQKQKLIDLGAKTLADTLLELAEKYDGVNSHIKLLTATPKENIQRFKRKLSALKRSKKFIDWRSTAKFCQDLKGLLHNLELGVDDPLTGIKLIAAFYESSNLILERCDDSHGNIDDVFRFDAKALFVKYASLCSEKEKIADIILSIIEKDEFGIRSILLDCCSEFLPEQIIRKMISTLQEQIDTKSEEYENYTLLISIQSLARQVKDAELLKSLYLTLWGELSASDVIDIAQVYVKRGDAKTALSILNEIPENQNTYAHEQEKLLLEIYKQLGDTDNLTTILQQKFSSYRSLDNLNELLDLAGHNKKEQIINDEIIKIEKSSLLNESNIKFMLAINKIEQAEQYLIRRADQLNGYNYTTLPSLAKDMEKHHCFLGASLIYRSLLISILERAYTKAYTYGARYLKKLDQLAETISDWKQVHHHETFKSQLIETHGKKRSFWSKYEEKK
jgi:hypothetical protein